MLKQRIKLRPISVDYTIRLTNKSKKVITKDHENERRQIKLTQS